MVPMDLLELQEKQAIQDGLDNEDILDLQAILDQWYCLDHVDLRATQANQVVFIVYKHPLSFYRQ